MNWFARISAALLLLHGSVGYAAAADQDNSKPLAKLDAMARAGDLAFVDEKGGTTRILRIDDHICHVTFFTDIQRDSMRARGASLDKESRIERVRTSNHIRIVGAPDGPSVLTISAGNSTEAAYQALQALREQCDPNPRLF